MAHNGHRSRCLARVRRGAAAVEFAMTAPILFVLVFGAVEFSRANMLVHTASIAATEAARKSIVAGATAAEVRLKALDELRMIGVVDATVTVDPSEIVDDTTQVTVNLTVPVSLRNGYGLSRIFLGRNVNKNVTLQREGKTEEVASEKVKKDGVSTNGNSGSGNSNSGSGNSGS
jgi:Flp pilus assembly protein TadG